MGGDNGHILYQKGTSEMTEKQDFLAAFEVAPQSLGSRIEFPDEGAEGSSRS
jgi:hypothetical protein